MDYSTRLAAVLELAPPGVCLGGSGIPVASAGGGGCGRRGMREVGNARGGGCWRRWVLEVVGAGGGGCWRWWVLEVVDAGGGECGRWMLVGALCQGK